MRATIGNLMDFTHGRNALLSVAQPGLGALLAAQGYPDRRTTTVGLLAAAAGSLCVYPLNDLLDLATDREEASRAASAALERGSAQRPGRRHPLARGALPVWVGASWTGGSGLTAFVLASRLKRDCSGFLVACVGIESLYCQLRRRTWLKTIPAGSLIGVGGLAGWYAVQDLDGDAFAFFLLLTLWEIFGRNISNDMADLSLDQPIGIRTVATTFGPQWSARACFAGAGAILLVAAAQRGPVSVRLALVAAAAWTMTIPALRLLRKPSESAAQRYFDRAKFFPPLAFLGATLLFLLRERRSCRR